MTMPAAMHDRPDAKWFSQKELLRGARQRRRAPCAGMQTPGVRWGIQVGSVMARLYAGFPQKYPCPYSIPSERTTASSSAVSMPSATIAQLSVRAMAT